MQKIIILITYFFIQISFCQNIYDVFFKNVNIINLEHNKVEINKNIGISNGKILVIENAKKSKIKGKHVINLKGKFIIPGLADAHVHLPENKEDAERFLKISLVHGVTKVRSMRGTFDHPSWKKDWETNKALLPKVILSSVPMHHSYKMSFEEMDSYVQNTKNYGFDLLKILSIKSTTDFKQLDSLCKKYQIPLGGHFLDNPKGVRFSDELFFNSSYTSIEHLGGLVGSPETLENRLQYIKNKEIYICPTLQWYAIGYGQFGIDEMLMGRGMQYFSKETREDWASKTKKYRESLGTDGFNEEKEKYALEIHERIQLLKKLNDFKIPMLLSPDSSTKYIAPGLGMLDEIEWYKKAGISNCDILKCATINFSKLYQIKDLLNENHEAEFLVLNQNPLKNLDALDDIWGIYINQNFINQEQLHQLRKELTLDAEKK